MSACSGLGSWCCSRLDARLVLLVRCCLRRRTAGIVGCWLSVLFAWPALVLCWCVPPPPGGACCVGLWPPSWWGALCWCVPPLLLGCAVLVPPCRDGGVWFGLSSPVGWVVVVVVLLAWPGLVLCWCVPPPPLLGRAVFVRAPPLGGAYCVGVFGFGSWCCSRLNARLVLLVRCCLRRRTAGVVGCLLPVVFAWPGSVLCWCVPPPLLGRAVLVRAPPIGGACCVGVFGFWFVVL